MSTPTITRAVELAARLDSAGIAVTLNPAEVAGRAPCILIGPPRLAFDTYSDPTPTWRLIAVASVSTSYEAWQQLDALVTAVADVEPVELAEPISYALSPTEDPRPAYALTLTGA